MADLRAVFTIVCVLRWGLHNIDVSVLSGACRPLDRHPRPADAGDDTVEEFEFWDEEVVQGLVPFPNPHSSIKDSILVFMEVVQSVQYFGESVSVVRGAAYDSLALEV